MDTQASAAVITPPPAIDLSQYQTASLYVDYCRSFTIAATGGIVIIGHKNERSAAAMMLGADDGLSARELNGNHYRSKLDVEAIVEALLGAREVKVVGSVH